ncbi:MAG: adenine deaminase [Bacteroidota bacterium]
MNIPDPFPISGNIVDVVNHRIFPGEVLVEHGRIKAISECKVKNSAFIMPGFTDAHIHIESSMLIPSGFARLAVVHGTVGTVSDPHEIANVLGVEGVKYMIENGKKVPFKFCFGAPSCVPATDFETAGAEIDARGVEELMKMEEIKYLAEMMNFPGVLAGDEMIMRKLRAAQKYGKVVDGHAPGLRGEDARKYIEAGISTDHECYSKEEALEKIKMGMKIIIREGSAAKNFDVLIELLDQFPDHIMLCSDDKHPNDLVSGHVNLLARRAVELGIKPMKVIRALTYNPVKHYGLDAGLLQAGDPADLIVVNNLEEFRVISTYINGKKVADEGVSHIKPVQGDEINNFNCSKISKSDIKPAIQGATIRVIEALDGQLITNEILAPANIIENTVVSDKENDILKMAVINRYHPSPPSIAFVKNFGLKKGAIASSVAHDSHNIIAVGVDDEDIVNAVNLLIENRGGISLTDEKEELILPLPVAGLMSAGDGYQIAEKYELLDKKAKKLGSTLSSPYMTLSFLALLVIPQLKLSDKGLFDGDKFQFTSLFAEENVRC